MATRFGIRWWKISFILLLLVFININVSVLTAADSSWVTEEPDVDVLSQLDDVTYLPKYMNGYPCKEREVVVRPEQLPHQTEESVPVCITETMFGNVSKSGMLQRPGNTVYGGVRPHAGRKRPIIPIPRSNTALYMAYSNFAGSYVAFIDDVSSKLDTTVPIGGRVEHTLDISGMEMLQDKSGHSLNIRSESISFSSNGEWMVADTSAYGTLRINTSTQEVLPFGPNLDYNIGVGPYMQTAITQDGRYAAVASNTFKLFRVYDLATCTDTPDRITGSVDCDFVDLYSYLKEDFTDYKAIHQPRFLSNDVLDLYVQTTEYDGQTIYRTVLSIDDGTIPDYPYLGLGDSFASGEGAYAYKADTDVDGNKCHVSLASYPYLIGGALGYGEHESIACSGAVFADVNIHDPDYYEGNTQAKGMSDNIYTPEILDNFLPGYRAQKLFVSTHKPQAVTVSIGGNDIGFGEIIKQCIMPDTCFDTYSERKSLLNTMDSEFDNFVDTYNQLSDANPQTRVYVLGYPSLAYPEGNCAQNVRLNKQELVFANQLVSYLNYVIKTAAERTGVYYVDVEDTFNGNRLCETDSWEVAVNGITHGDDDILGDGFAARLNPVNGPIGNESFHPNKLGHELYAKTVILKTNGLTNPMPRADSNASLDINHDDLPMLQDVQKETAIQKTMYIHNMSPGGMIMHQIAPVDIPLDEVVFMPGTEVQTWFHSTPTYAGALTADETGKLAGDITVPEMDPGYHTLHLLGTNSGGEEVDVYQYVYVAASETDWDGDGIPNDEEECLIGEPSGQDQDADGIDDACDAMIGPPPATTSQEPEHDDRNSSSEVVYKQQTDQSEPAQGTPQINLASATEPQTQEPQTQTRTTATATPDADSEVLGAGQDKPAVKQDNLMSNWLLTVAFVALIGTGALTWLVIKKM